MQIRFTHDEMIALSNVVDKIIGSVNRVGCEVFHNEINCAPRDITKKIENFLNNSLCKTTATTKIFKVEIGWSANLIITVHEEFLIDSAGIGSVALTFYLPFIIAVGKAAKQVAMGGEILNAELETFRSKYFCTCGSDEET